MKGEFFLVGSRPWEVKNRLIGCSVVDGSCRFACDESVCRNSRRTEAERDVEVQQIKKRCGVSHAPERKWKNKQILHL